MPVATHEEVEVKYRMKAGPLHIQHPEGNILFQII